jgi:hypothetical protein
LEFRAEHYEYTRGIYGSSAINNIGNIIYTYIYKGQTIEVTTRVVDGTNRIVDAWVKTR